MSWQDAINGLIFEAGAGLVVWLNVRALLQDKKVNGVSWFSFAFFTSMGVWNLYYYPHLDQWLSFIGSLLVVSGNLAWCVMALRYGHGRERAHG